MRCEKCNAEGFFLRCPEHHKCDMCGEAKNLCHYMRGLLCEKCNKLDLEKRIKEFDGDTDYTNEIVCPYCGHETSDSWECADSNDDYECGECDNHFSYYRDVEVTYCSKKKGQK